LPRGNILGEPVGRDSLNAVAWSTAVVAQRDPAGVVAVLSADHVINPVAAFTAALGQAFAAAEQDRDALVTMGVVPTSPHTGFGYLHRGQPAAGLTGVWQVEEFAEKPPRAVAEAYFAAGDWWWNSGLFCWRAETFLEQLAGFMPETAAAIRDIAADPSRLAAVYPTLTKVSVDYAIMEPVSRGSGPCHILAVPLEADWDDIGGYTALADHLDHIGGNAQTGRVVALDASGNLLVNAGPPDSLIAVVGLRDTVVVTHGGVTLVCPRSAAEAVKALVERVRTEAGPAYV
jgi:mannose-1-phosphate guanylyltransferase